ncbi:hypothetical protein SAMN06296058_1580 [Pseudoxanthomonas indica]|uniref:Uncharacterized protein n=1 Tax=Pseudoxanthomonas indica TaxID=428993 RepID=A0A1T5KCM7_9GAMM|nr:hypothetical protein SAMN06296058_1580 [Pseudoxanthomonas indica]
MKVLPLVLILLCAALVAGKVCAQSFFCNGQPRTTYSTCEPCPNSYQTRSQLRCTQPTDIQGNGCGAITCEGTCTCEEAPSNDASTGNADWVRQFERRNSGAPSGAREQAGTLPQQPQRSSSPQLQNAELPAAGGPRIRADDSVPMADVEISSCLRRVGKVGPLNRDDASLIVVTLQNTCSQCISGKVQVTNGKGEVGRDPFGRPARPSYFRPNLSVSTSFRVGDNAEWVWRDDVAVDVPDGRKRICQ